MIDFQSQLIGRYFNWKNIRLQIWWMWVRILLFRQIGAVWFWCMVDGNNSYTKELSLNNKQLNAKVINMNVGKTARVINMFNKSYVIAAWLAWKQKMSESKLRLRVRGTSAK